jgi:CRP/FNR family cyclic AMP-dependent transcriptional regulator
VSPAVDIAAIPVFHGIDRAAQERLRSHATVRAFHKGATILLEGQDSEGLFVVDSGLVRVFKTHIDGREKTLALLKPGEVLGEMTLTGSDLRSATAAAVEPSTLLVIPRDVFRAVLESHPPLAMRVIEMLSTRLREADESIHELAFLTARGRVVCSLGRLAQSHGTAEHDGGVWLKTTHAELAQLAGVSRETATTVLNDLQDRNLVETGNRRLHVLEPERLCDRSWL